mmetsp:Transcript_17025/g.25427  ORF Transcript_17025/g.25427 Transcript_17025/m.25427 type:complete len:466 (-) Transcript_17025:148-1545(-)
MADYYTTNAYSRPNAGGGNNDNSSSNSGSTNEFYSNPYGYSNQQTNAQGQQQQQQQQQGQPSIFSAMANNQNNVNNNGNAAPSFWNPVATQFATAALNSVTGNGAGGGTGSGPGANNNNIDPYAQIAIDQGRTFVTSYTAKLIPGLETFMNTFRIYFAVDNGYVKRKMVRVLFSFFCKNWSRKKIDTPIPSIKDPTVAAAAQTQSVAGGQGPSSSFTSTKTITTYAVPRDDDNAPDLYIPFMSLITYVLISALCYGTAGQFDPDVIVNVTTKCIFTQLVEVCLFKIGVYIMSSSSGSNGGDLGNNTGSGGGVAFWDLFAFTGYKYLALTCNLIIGFGVSMVGSGSGSSIASSSSGVLSDGTGGEDDDEGSAPIKSNIGEAAIGGGYGQKGYYIMFLWTASSICYFMLKTMANNIPQDKQMQQQQQYYTQTMQQQKSGPTREIVILVFALSQFGTLWFLGQTKFLD